MSQQEPPTCYLTRIPVEVLLRITSFISTTDLGNVRLACRSLEQSLFHFFSHEFFRKKQFMVFSQSLQALIDISNHLTLSPCLRHVIIATDSIGHRRFPPLRVDGPDDLGDQIHLAQSDQDNLLSSGGLKDMLAEAFRNLPNLEIIDIRDFNSTTRNREGHGSEWHSYGARTLAEAIGDTLDSRPYDRRPRFPDQIFAAVTAALASVDARPQEIRVNIRSFGNLPWALTDSAFYIPPRLEPSLRPVLQQLTTLHLAMCRTSAPADVGASMLHRFLSLTPNLTWLRLNLTVYESSNTMTMPWERVFRWFIDESTIAYPSSPYRTDPIRLPKLTQLDLGSVVMAERTLLRLVAKFAPSLRIFWLRRVMLADPVDADAPNGWTHFFQKLATIPGIDIRDVGLSFLQNARTKPNHVFHGRQNWVKNMVEFVDVKGRDSQHRDRKERSYSGTSTAAIATCIASDMTVAMVPGDSIIAADDLSDSDAENSMTDEDDDEDGDGDGDEDEAMDDAEEGEE